MDPYVKVTIHIPIWASSQSGDTVTPVPVAPAQEARPAQKGGDKRKGRAGPAPVGGATSKSSSPEGWLSESGQKGDEEAGSAVGERVVKAKTDTIRNNGFNPIWDEKLTLPFDVFGEGMEDLIFVRFLVKDDNMDGDEFVGGYCTGLGSLEMGEWSACIPVALSDGCVAQAIDISRSTTDKSTRSSSLASLFISRSKNVRGCMYCGMLELYLSLLLGLFISLSPHDTMRVKW